ncbi:tRNA pseudouridine synthase-like 1 [Harpegnathos saltator]|uniref:tRNA pseudouridine synthase-like 1 n=1 Tax=Harpegnathos saltator TaxID=610380 RepID=UPI00058BFA7D|nr:tRNA pseudouridine synthase-like 1 [Harpegnathos saltator]XP_011154893.1 tRNA pseudouridine synthase-like 1 [Harpegnathos saltator]
MVRYFFRFSYIGTQYRGVQKQVSVPNIRDGDTVQGALEAALLNILPKTTIRPNIYLSSRTDAGVHALCNAGHVELENKYNVLYKDDNIKAFVNRYFNKCGHTIRLLEFTPVTNDFHARGSCKSRTYIYRFMIPKVPGEQRIPLVDAPHTYLVKAHDFDVDRVKCGTQLFMGVKDFTTFSSMSITNRKIEYVRALHDFTLEEAQSLISFDPLSENFRYFQFVCKARSFLYNQVRRMVGALISLGLRKITEKDINVMLQVPSHHNWNPRASSAPANGLHLVNLEYDEEELKRCTLSEEQHEKMLLEQQDQKVQSEEQNQDLLPEEQEEQEQERQQELAK